MPRGEDSVSLWGKRAHGVPISLKIPSVDNLELQDLPVQMPDAEESYGGDSYHLLVLCSPLFTFLSFSPLYI